MCMRRGGGVNYFAKFNLLFFKCSFIFNVNEHILLIVHKVINIYQNKGTFLCNLTVQISCLHSKKVLFLKGAFVSLNRGQNRSLLTQNFYTPSAERERFFNNKKRHCELQMHWSDEAIYRIYYQQYSNLMCQNCTALFKKLH